MDKLPIRQNNKSILVVDDQPDLVRLVSFNLGKEGYLVRAASTGTEALQAVLESPPDLVILDIMLPEMDGLEVCRRLRSSRRTAAVPILMLSARKEELDKVLGLEMGADDYVVKPFSVRELVARVRALLRRGERKGEPGAGQPAEDEAVLAVKDIVLYPERHQVTVRGEPCTLTHKEFSLLHLLMAGAGKVLTRELLLERVWGYETEVDTRTVDVHVRYLRQKIEEDPANPVYIETVRGVGYRFSRV